MLTYQNKATLCITLLTLTLAYVDAHGYLLDPPSRSSLWRHGFNVKPNYDDNALYCGGKEIQWRLNGGKCGLCGDRYDGPRHNEAGGTYATGIISRTFKKGQTIPITIVVTAPHAGWFEFRICSNNNVSKPITQECLNKHLLRLTKDGSTRFENVAKTAPLNEPVVYMLDYQLPAELTCKQCVLQWFYNTGKDWGCVPGTRLCGVGLGEQEQFFGCADIAITEDGSELPTTLTPKVTAKATSRTTTQRPKTGAPLTTRPSSTKVTTKATTTSQPTTQRATTKRSTTQKPLPITLTQTPQKPTTKDSKLAPSTRQRKSTNTPTTQSPVTQPPIPQEPCRGSGIFRGTVMDTRCVFICSRGTCPKTMCNEACRHLAKYID